MAGIAPSTGRGGRRALDAAVNVVPFIDLLSCCLAFLLITAAWTQLAQLDVHRAGAPEESTDSRFPPAPAPTLTLSTDGFVLTADGVAHELSTIGEVSTRLRDWRGAHRDREDLEVRVIDGVAYAEVVRAIDVARGAGFEALRFID